MGTMCESLVFVIICVPQKVEYYGNTNRNTHHSKMGIKLAGNIFRKNGGGGK
jgi:hypothetical protein